MLTFNQTIGEDKDVIWFYRGTLTDGTILYLTDYLGNLILTHEGNDITYDGGSTQKEENIIDFNYDLMLDNTTNTVASINLIIGRNSSNSLLDSFQNEFYPNTSKYLTNSTWEVGIGWEGITDYEDITWLYNFYCIKAYNDYSSLTLELNSFDLYNVELPKNVIQNNNEYLNYYFPNAPKENLGECLPILYGEFSRKIDDDDYSYEIFDFAPTICVDETTKKYFYASHKCSVVSSTKTLYRYSEDLDTFFKISTNYGENVNNKFNAFIAFFDPDFTEGTKVTGAVSLRSVSDKRLNNYNVDGSVTKIEFVPSGYLDIYLDYDKLTDNMIGVLSSASSDDIEWFIRAQRVSENQILWTYVENPYYSIPKTESWTINQSGDNYNEIDFGFAEDTTMKSGSQLPHTVGELTQWFLRLRAGDSNTESLFVQCAVMRLSNITIYYIPITKKYKQLNYPKHTIKIKYAGIG